MAFRDFTFPTVLTDLGLSARDADLFSAVSPWPVREEFAAFVRDGTALAQAIATEKAKSEFIIAPVLLEVRRSLNNAFALFSGVEWNPDPQRGLNGYCDFILTRGASQMFVSAPIVAIAGAKTDNIVTGLGQCIAAMVGAHIVNEREGRTGTVVHGVVTFGVAWKFLRLTGSDLTIDGSEYLISDLPKLMGILRHIVETR